MQTAPQEKKKIKVVIGMNDFFIGGGQRLVVDILKQGVFANDEVHLVTFAHDPKRENFLAELPPYVQHHALQFKHFLDILGWIELFKTLWRVRPDVVWSHFFFSNAAFRILKMFFGYRVIIVEHNTYAWKTRWQRLLDRVLSVVTYKIVAVSDSVATFTAHQEHISPEKFVVIPNGVDIERMQEEVGNLTPEEAKHLLSLPTNRKYIINVARLSTQKNHTLLVDAFALFAKEQKDYDLLIVGDGPERPALEHRAQSHGIRDRVVFVGSKMNVSQYYRASDFFVLTSDIEGFALVCIEAMSLGLSIISTRVAGPDVYIKDGQNGFLVDSDASSVAVGMQALAQRSPAKVEEMSTCAIRTAGEFDIKRCAESHRDLLA